MVKILQKITSYLCPLIQGSDNNISLKNCIAVAFVVGFLKNVNKSTEGTLGIMAGLIAGLLGLQVYNNLNQRKLDNEHDAVVADDSCSDKGTNGGRGGTS